MDFESTVMEIIINSGQAKSFALEALDKAKEGLFYDLYAGTRIG